MKSDLEKFLSVLLQLLRGLKEQLGALAWAALGVFLIGGVLACAFALRWIRRGGLRTGATQRFFAEQRELKRWFTNHKP
ncbi:exported hypothetical protein [Verrucomicrobia bacterium]|nr:exported hypothetical protein [Verrucomicrobiota bacterium]